MSGSGGSRSIVEAVAGAGQLRASFRSLAVLEGLELGPEALQVQHSTSWPALDFICLGQET